MTRREQLFINIGLIMVTSPILLNDWIQIPGFMRGMLTGWGLGLEIVALMLIARRKKNHDVPDC